MRKLSAREFYQNWLSTAFRHSIGRIDLWSGLCAAAITIVIRFLPQWETTLRDILWQVPIWIAAVTAAIVLVRLVAAPWWMWEERQKEVNLVQNRLSELLDEYAHALAIQQIDFNAGDDADQYELALCFRNTISRPIRYTINDFKISGYDSKLTVNSAVIPPYTQSWYFSETIAGFPPLIDGHRKLYLDLVIQYGPPTGSLRELRRSVILIILPTQTRSLITADTDVPVP